MVSHSEATEAVFRAIGDATRRRILDGLVVGSRRATDIAADFEVTRPAIVKHLRILADAGLVRVEKHGRERHYHLQGARLAQVDRWLTTYRTLWSGRLMALKRRVESTSGDGSRRGAGG